jgi:hypothetical protein
MKTHLILGVAALALAACGSSGSDKGGESGNGSAAAAGGGGSASGVSLQPGEWEMKMEVVNVTAKGLPEGAADGLKNQAAKTSRTCMTPEEAKGPSADMFASNNPGNCKSEGFSWAGGRIQGKTTCTGQGAAGKTVMTMDGRYSPQSIDMTMKSDTDVMGTAMTMEMRMTGRRVGECTAATKEG